MSEIMWKKEYSIGVVEIDHQHKKLFELLRDLQVSLTNGITNPIVGKTLKDLVEYTQVHFRGEEHLMRQIKYDDLENHLKLHEELVIEVKEQLIKLKNGKDVTALDLINILKHWLEDHILNEDIKIGKVLQSRIEEAREGLHVSEVQQ